MVNLSLDLFKMEQGTYQYEPTPVEVLSTIDDIVQENQILISSKQVSLEIRINGNLVSESASFEVPGENLLFYSMLANLIKNALEASPEKAKLGIDLKSEDGYIISIHNEGAVPEEMRPIFFDKYSTSGKLGGSGLGTYSARLITQTLGGKIQLETNQETGTSVIISLPST